MRTVVVVAASDGGLQHVPRSARHAERIISADGGLDLAESLGLVSHLVVGDLDSVTEGALGRARDLLTEVRVSPTDKDQTDLELALVEAGQDPEVRTLVLGGAGGRLDHLLANIAVIAARPQPVEGWIGAALVVPVVDSWQRDLPEGVVVSLLAWGGDAVVSTSGLRWGLDSETLHLGSARGVSNLATGGPIEVSVTSGCVLVVIPDAAEAL